MYKIIKKHKNPQNINTIILLHEIYGINRHIKDVADKLGNYGFDIYCPNLLDITRYFNYNEEDKAYNYFMNKITIESAFEKTQKIINDLKNKYEKIIIIGFSVGATLTWLCSINKYCDGVIGFYGSRIRDYCDISPLCPTLLFFPEREKSFEVQKLKNILLEKENIEIKIFKGEHGFADRYSYNYNEASYNKSQKLIKIFLKRYNE